MASNRKYKKDVTIHDVAAASGVSIGTVSRVLNNNPNVNENTRKKVLQVSRDLGIRARLSTDRYSIAIIIADDHFSTYITELLAKLTIKCSNLNMSVSVLTYQNYEMLDTQLFDGVLFVSYRDIDLIRIDSLQPTPTLLVNQFHEIDTHYNVGWNHYDEGYIVAKYLLENGHKSPALIATAQVESHAEERIKGFLKACYEYGEEIDPQVTFEFRGAKFATTIKRFVAKGIDALYIPGNPETCAEALRILKGQLNLNIPKDLSLIGSESIQLSEHLDPEITTIDNNVDALAALCASSILKLIKKEKVPFMQYTNKSKIIERDTVISRK